MKGLALPASPFPLPPAAFLAPSAFILPPATSSGAGSPPLHLSDLLISTPSCSSLSLHQDFACRQLGLLAYPNFTITPTSLRVVIAGSPDGSTVLDLANRRGVVDIGSRACVHLANLTLVNAPLGPVEERPESLLRGLIWTFAFRRTRFGAEASRLTGTGVRLAVPPDELAYWMASALYNSSSYDDSQDGSQDFVPEDLRPSLCAMGLSRMKAEVHEAMRLQTGAPGLRLRITTASDMLNISDLLFFPDDNERGLVLCQLRPEGLPPSVMVPFPRPVKADETTSIWQLTRNNSQAGLIMLVWYTAALNAAYNPFNGRLEPAVVVRPTLLFGDPLEAVALDVRCLAGALVPTPRRFTLVVRQNSRAERHAIAAGAQAPARGSLSGNGTGRGGTVQRRQAQSDENPSGSTPVDVDKQTLTQGLAAPMANFTSCLWTVDFDRPAALGGAAAAGRPRGLPHVFVDSVVLLVPRAELDWLATMWAAAADSDIVASVTAAAMSASGAFGAESAALAAQVAAMWAGSRLAPETASALAAAEESGLTGSTAGTEPAITALMFEDFEWCGLRGRNPASRKRLGGAGSGITAAGSGEDGGDVGGGSLRLVRIAVPLPVEEALEEAATAASGGALLIRGELGRGAQGVVYRGTWRGLAVAVKSILIQVPGSGGPESTPTDPRVRQAVAEAAISTSVSHPNVIATYTYMLQRLDGWYGGGASGDVTAAVSADPRVCCAAATAVAASEPEVWKLTLVQELCEGGSLRDCLARGVLAGCTAVRAAGAARVAAVPRHASGISPLWSAGTFLIPLSPVTPTPVPAQMPPWLPSPRVSTSDEITGDGDGGASRGGSGGNSDGPADAGPGAGGNPYTPVMLLAALQAAHGLAHLHARSVVHADVSSSNVLLQRDRNGSGCGPGDPFSSWSAGSCVGSAAESSHRYGWVAKLCDFGLSGRLEAEEQQTHLSGPARRSSAYSAPELVRAGQAGPPGDVYALAVVMWELALGRPLPEALAAPEGQRLRAWLAAQATADPTEASALPPGLLAWPEHTPQALVPLVEDCLRESPAERPSAERVCERLQAILAACQL
ncbi:hypothetical protein GPECTOR_1g82 [Gonium pectorale]|uniref:Protein kinase domain-containing protein n=1 Tax=Gonium pectorale TaxID=33097 RepID=A0A150H434_GONPE|nr:hypothetical protein GPECTOR_1g82 [Gonium pectorale]|eukprot:KXZ56909.1 hypothetical protein GPECTOR_1g82 [Gonium pectorale]